MWRYLAGGLAVLLLVGSGVLLYSPPAASVAALPQRPPVAAGAPSAADETAPLPATAPSAAPRTREQKRFDRYDKDRNSSITRDEYLAQRRKAYAKLDVDRDGKLNFEEWAVTTTDKFAKADRDRSGTLTPVEFATTAVKRKPTARCPAPDADS